MKRVILGSSAAILFAFSASCGSDATTPNAVAGAPQAVAGAPSSGGSPGSAGSAEAGTPAAVAGAAPMGGSPAVAGAASGGSSGSGEAGGSVAGSPGQAGASAGTGGAAGTAGAAGGPAEAGSAGKASGGSGGTAGSGGSGGASGGSTGGGSAGAGDLIATVAKTWDGALVTYPCANNGSGYDCGNLGCANNMVTKTTSWTLGGDPNTTYSVTFNVRGILEAYAYEGGTRDAGNASITQNKDLFLRGGKAQGPGGANYDYNVYSLEVTPAVTGEANVYFLNSVTTAEGPHAPNTPTSHLTFDINYIKTIKVKGGGTVTMKLFDSNCTLVQNCGPTSGNTCAAPRRVPLEGVTPAAPSSFMQPFQMPSGKYGQWVFFDITNVVVAP